ncbi:MAG: hypothetical protein K5765_06395 [Clostridia bacterium]|nr:hypothetical protein [Clostridia bacterium]
MNLELNTKERETLLGILKTECFELEEEINSEPNEKDKKGLEKELEVVKNLLEKLS